MPLHPGTLGPYSVTAKIGEGGMGEVWQVRDTKLDRDVALKVLPQGMGSGKLLMRLPTRACHTHRSRRSLCVSCVHWLC